MNNIHSAEDYFLLFENDFYHLNWFQKSKQIEASKQSLIP